MRIWLGDGDIREAEKVKVDGSLTLVRLQDGRLEWVTRTEILEDRPYRTVPDLDRRPLITGNNFWCSRGVR